LGPTSPASSSALEFKNKNKRISVTSYYNLHISIFGFLPFFGADANRVASCGEKKKKTKKDIRRDGELKATIVNRRNFYVFSSVFLL
jgi:hypothetical protein